MLRPKVTRAMTHCAPSASAHTLALAVLALGAIIFTPSAAESMQVATVAGVNPNTGHPYVCAGFTVGSQSLYVQVSNPAGAGGPMPSTDGSEGGWYARAGYGYGGCGI
jgi:hypothetical protein